MSIHEDVRKMKLDALAMAASSSEIRNCALRLVGEALKASAADIFAANKLDLAAAESQEVAPQVVKRLRFDDQKLKDVVAGIDQLIQLPDPVGHITLDRELDEGLELQRITCPIGVIGVIFEARPDALVQISTLCIKSGNCAILKGGKETTHTNKALFSVIHDAAVKAGLPAGCLMQAESHADVDELLGCDGDVDLLIPRGSNTFVRYIMDHTRIPVLGHADGICHVYIDEAADPACAKAVVIDSKTQYVAVCNAAETLLIDRATPTKLVCELVQALQAKGVEVRGTDELRAIVACEPTNDADWDTEYLALTISVCLVDGVEGAIEHINRHGSHHTDAIVTTNEEAAQRFCQMVDSAGTYVNCSTRFADGFRYGFGAEVGIATSKIHARGPVGLDGLMTYKYVLRGNGHVVADYASGKRHFTHRDLDK